MSVCMCACACVGRQTSLYKNEIKKLSPIKCPVKMHFYRLIPIVDMSSRNGEVLVHLFCRLGYKKSEYLARKQAYKCMQTVQIHSLFSKLKLLIICLL